MIDFSPMAWLDAAVIWFFSWPHWLEYLLVGWVIYCVMLQQKKVTPRNYRGVLVTTLTMWPIPFALLLLEWVHLAAVWLIEVPFAAVAETFRRAFSRWDTHNTITRE